MLLLLVFLAEGGYSQCKVSIMADSVELDSLSICRGDSVMLHVQGEYLLVNETFGTGSPGAWWSFITPNASFQPNCDTTNPTNCLWFGPLSVPDRILQTQDLDFSQGGILTFDLKFALQNGPVGCEGPDEMLEGVSLQYSLDQGGTWVDITYFCPNGSFLPANPWVQSPLTMFPTPFTIWTNYTFPIPVAAMTNHTRLRWIQESTSFFNGHYDDNWGLDNIRISRSIDQDVVWGNGSTAVVIQDLTPQQTTTYYVYVINNLNPLDTLSMDSITIVVLPQPVFGISGDSTLCPGDITTLSVSGDYSFQWNTGEASLAIVVAPEMGTIYYVTATNSYGCRLAKQKEILIFSNPVVILTGDSVCPGEMAYLQASGGIQYLWSNGATAANLQLQPTTSTLYGVTITDANGCEDSASVLLKVFSLPVIEMSEDTVICYGDQAHIKAGGGVFYHWNTGAVKQEIYVDPIEETQYWVTVTDIHACINTAGVTVSVNPFHEIQLTTSRDTVCHGSSVTLLASGGSEYEWSTGRLDPEITDYPDYSSVYTVTVSDVYMGTWCRLVSSVEVQVKECENFFFPNAILPKGYNPVFKPIGEYQQIIKYVMVIYDRWGKKVFESRDPALGWDGTINGEYVQQGTYIYRVQFNKTLNGDPYDRTGTVTVLY